MAQPGTGSVSTRQKRKCLAFTGLAMLVASFPTFKLYPKWYENIVWT